MAIKRVEEIYIVNVRKRISHENSCGEY